MSRPVNLETRRALRDAAVRYVLAHGFADLSLRPLAAALGTSARMLVYHFGSRAGLLRAILEGLRELVDAEIEGWLARGPGPRSLADFLPWYWARASAPEARAALRVVFELYALALRRPKDYPGVLDTPLAYWAGLRARTAGGAVKDDPALVTLVLAATRGLLLDVCATGETRRTGAALALLADLVRAREARPRRARRSR
jgi:AcrR family transcriptional regulator